MAASRSGTSLVNISQRGIKAAFVWWLFLPSACMFGIRAHTNKLLKINWVPMYVVVGQHTTKTATRYYFKFHKFHFCSSCIGKYWHSGIMSCFDTYLMVSWHSWRCSLAFLTSVSFNRTRVPIVRWSFAGFWKMLSSTPWSCASDDNNMWNQNKSGKVNLHSQAWEYASMNYQCHI